MMLFLKDKSNVLLYNNKCVFKGGGFMGFKPPPPKFSDFFLKSEGKEIKRKRKKRKIKKI